MPTRPYRFKDDDVDRGCHFDTWDSDTGGPNEW